jgi:hypothetical protein
LIRRRIQWRRVWRRIRIAMVTIRIHTTTDQDGYAERYASHGTG